MAIEEITERLETNMGILCILVIVIMELLLLLLLLLSLKIAIGTYTLVANRARCI